MRMRPDPMLGYAYSETTPEHRQGSGDAPKPPMQQVYFFGIFV